MLENKQGQPEQLVDLENMTVKEMSDLLSQVVLLLRRFPPDMVPGTLEQNEGEDDE